MRLAAGLSRPVGRGRDPRAAQSQLRDGSAGPILQPRIVPNAEQFREIMGKLLASRFPAQRR